MIFKLIDGFTSEGEATLWNGQSLPLPSLVKDDQGQRTLLVEGEEVPVNIWAAASMSGATTIYRPNGSWVSRGEFEELAELKESEALYRVHEFMWHPHVPQAVSEPQEATQGREEASEELSSPALETDDVTEPAAFVHLHTHSEFSALDGLATVEEIVKVAVAQRQTSVAITDHGGCWGHPDFQKACEDAGVKPIFGMEAYLVDNRFDREDNDYYHITLWAMSDKGLTNLWAMSTEGYRDGFHGKPRIDWDTLERLNDGVAASSGCLRGPLSREINDGNVHRAQTNSKRMSDIFGDRYYIELHTNHLEEQVKVNKWLVKHAQEFDIPLIAAVDSHYAAKEQRDDHQVWIAAQTGKGVGDIDLFGGGQDYHMADEDEVFEHLAYLGPELAFQAMQNTLTLADRCNAKVSIRQGMPSYTGDPDKDVEKAFEIIEANWEERTKDKPYTQEEAVARFEREMGVLVPKWFMGYFCQNWDLVRYAKENGVLVGPGRGSGAGSFVAYLMGIVEVDPLEHDLMFERFMTEGRTALPDFDIDYPSSKKQFMIDYAESRWGKKHVCAVGTTTRLRNKGAFKKTAMAIKHRLPDDYFTDVELLSKIIGAAEASTAGLGLKWDELMDVCEEEFAPFKRKYPELFFLAEKFHGRVTTYSRHAAGLVIDPQYDLEASLPMMLSSDGKTLVTQFDKDVLDRLGYVKFDFLNLRNLDTLQDTLDLIYAQTGDRINVYKWRSEYEDERVFQEISDGWTLGLFQIETALGTRTVKQLKPKNLNDLADCITIGRPGPIRSGLDRTYFRRREGKEKVTFADSRLESVLSRTYGTMIYQEDIMATCIVLCNYTDNEADYVRKILGKKKPEEAKKEGVKFIQRAIETNTDPKVAERLWTQMEEFSRYSFNRAHAFAYAVLAYWTGWFKIHYSLQFATAVLSTIEKDEIPDWVSEARRLGFKVLPPDINESKSGFTNTQDTVRYGLDSLKGIAGVATSWITANQPFTSWEDFEERRDTEKCDMGVVKKLVHIGAFDSLVPNRKALEARLAEEDLKPGERCIFFQLEPRNKYNDLPCGFDWDSEPKKLGRTGKPLKNQKPPPKICSKACRQWTPRDLPTDDEVEPYTDAEIRNIEIDTLGIYLSSSPFDVLDEEDRSFLMTADQIMTEPSGSYPTVFMVKKVKDHVTKDSKLMKFVTAETPSGTMDITVFSDKLPVYGQFLRPGQMALAEVKKNDRGVTLETLEAL